MSEKEMISIGLKPIINIHPFYIGFDSFKLNKVKWIALFTFTEWKVEAKLASTKDQRTITQWININYFKNHYNELKHTWEKQIQLIN